MIGAILQSRYHIEQELGAGGVGIVYRAHDAVLNRAVAVKLLSGKKLGTEGEARLLAEAQSTARLNHPNIVSVHDAGEAVVVGHEKPVPFIVMELIHGRTLREQLPETFEEVIEIARQVCAALDHAHANGIIHRDLKPENILLTDNKRVKLMDFGLARSTHAPHLTAEGTIMGTFSYLSPEVIMGQPATAQSDLYALGVMLYELTAGQPPFTGINLMTILSQHLHAPVVPPSNYHPEIPVWFDRLVIELLSKKPEQRPESAGTVRRLLDKPSTTTSVMARQELTPTLPLDRLVRGKLVGREQEFREARQRWQAAVSGDPGILLISGEPGIGKSRLVKELIALTEISGAAALVGECYAEGGPPYMAVAQIVRKAFADSEAALPLPNFVMADLIALAPDLAAQFPHVPANPPLDAQAEQLRLFESIFAFCEGLTEQSPLLLVLEDAHWADGGTLVLVRHLARRARTMAIPLLIVVTYREVELAGAAVLSKVLVDFNRERLATRIKLLRLDRDKTCEMLTAMFDEETTPEFLEGIYRETEGNPFFIEEVCKALVEEGELYREGGRWRRPSMEDLHIPQSVVVTIQSRVNHLPEDAQNILRLAAIIGREFDFDTLSQAGDVDEELLIDSLETAVRAQLILEVEDRGYETFTFAHALIPAALRESVSGLRRHRMHRRVAQAIEKIRPEDYETLAYHFSQAGDEGRAKTHYRQAGDRALAAYANEDAEKHYRAALEMEQAPLERAALLAGLGESLSRQSRYEEAARTWQRAIDRFMTEGDYQQTAWLYARLGRAVSYSGDLPGSMAYCREGLAAVEGQPESKEMAALFHEAARAYHFNGFSDKARSLCTRALAIAEKFEDVRVQADTLCTFGILPGVEHMVGREMLRRAAELAEANELLETAARAFNNLANNLEESGELGAARENYQKAAGYCRRRGSASEELFVLSQVVDASLWLGDFQEAEQLLPALRDLEEKATSFAAGAFSLEHTEILLLRYRGDWAKALQRFRSFRDDMRERGELQQLTNSSFYLAETLLELGDLEEAEKALLEIAGIAGENPHGRAFWAYCLLVVVYVRSGRLSEAKTWLEGVQTIIRTQSTRFNDSYLLLAEAAVAQAEQQWDVALEKFGTLTKDWHEMGMRWYEAAALWAWAGVYAERDGPGDREKAQDLLNKALALFTQMELPNYVDFMLKKIGML